MEVVVVDELAVVVAVAARHLQLPPVRRAVARAHRRRHRRRPRGDDAAGVGGVAVAPHFALDGGGAAAEGEGAADDRAEQRGVLAFLGAQPGARVVTVGAVGLRVALRRTRALARPLVAQRPRGEEAHRLRQRRPPDRRPRQ